MTTLSIKYLIIDNGVLIYTLFQTKERGSQLEERIIWKYFSQIGIAIKVLFYLFGFPLSIRSMPFQDSVSPHASSGQMIHFFSCLISVSFSVLYFDFIFYSMRTVHARETYNASGSQACKYIFDS